MTDADVDAISEALADLKGKKGVTCFLNRMVVYFPRGTDSQRRSAGEIGRKMSKAFGGKTEWDGTGCWWNKETGKEVCEPVRVIEAANNCGDSEAAVDTLHEVGAKAKQENQWTVGVSAANRFYVVPPGHLVAKGKLETPRDRPLF